MCSYLGLSARDLAEIGGFSDRFARDLLAGRRPFPSDTKHTLEQLFHDLENITEALTLELNAGERTVYVYRTNKQLRASPLGSVLPARGKSAGGFTGPFRVAVLGAWRKLRDQGIDVELIFASTPDAGE
jgi:hypothetical protein